ncbi:MAG: hypothetical protein KKG47_10935 [Proteobacteria bacterium]|nr:hypothetical protein [Pseudomonadota bacterium]MBU1738619.1 hypothetical protein [Pseudomonadota bacterium]
MKKFISLLTIAALLNPVGATISIADFGDMSDQVESTLNIWIGGYLSETDNTVVPSFADNYSQTTALLPEAAGRVASNKAAEYHSLDSSPSGGILFKDAHAPNRIHLEFDFEDEDSWFGDLRYSYQDYFLLRVLPRRLRHNLESLTLYDYDPAGGGTNIQILDDSNTARIIDYGLTMDIDEYRVRLKTPNFPLHIYSNGEIVKKKGMRQNRFLGGAAQFSNRVRVSEELDIDQEKQEFTIGTNAHLGPIEFDLSTQKRTFESDAITPIYTYTFGDSPHHAIPKLEATTNTLKIHTSHSGRIFASTTFSEIEKTNETSQAEAENSLGYGELVWLPASYVSFTTKYRHQKNENQAPLTVDAIGSGGTLVTYSGVEPGVDSTTDTASLSVRYSQIPSTNIKLSYINKIKEVDDASALIWSRPLKQTSNIYEMGITNWAIPKVRVTAKARHTNLDQDFGQQYGIEAVSNDPETINHGNLGITWVISPKVAAFISGIVTKEETDDLRFVGLDEHRAAEALRQQYLASIAFMINDKLSITPSYTYILDQHKRDIIWESTIETADPDGTTTGDVTGAFMGVSDTSNQQKAHNFSLSVMYSPTKKMDINASVDFTTTEGTYEPTSPVTLYSRTNDGILANIPFSYDTAEAAQFSYTKTQEINVRLDTDYEIGHGWGIGVDVQYVDWKDDSFDNPSDSTYIGGLVKITKTIF